MNVIKKKIKAKGNYQFFVNGEVVADKNNLIVNQGLLGSSSFFKSTPYYCVLGTGTTPVELTDSELENKQLHDSITSTVTNYSTTDGVKYKETSKTCAFDAGAFIGDLSEVGVSPVSSVTNVMSRTVLPTPITLTATDQLTVVYTYILEVPAFDDTTVINIFGNDVSCRLVSVDLDARTFTDSRAFQTTGSYSVAFLEDMTSVVKDETILNNTYSTDESFSVVPINPNVNSDNVSGVVELTTDILNHLSGIYALGFSNVTNKPTFMLIFDQPIMKTSSDLITITIDIQLVMENV